MRREVRVTNWSRGARTIDIGEREIDHRKTLTNRDIKRLGVENLEKFICECVEGSDDIVKVGGFGTVSVIPIALDLEYLSVILLIYTPLTSFMEAEGGKNTCLRTCSTMDASMDASVWDPVPLDIVNRMSALSRTERVSLPVEALIAPGAVVGGLHSALSEGSSLEELSAIADGSRDYQGI